MTLSGNSGKKWQPNAGFMTHVTCRLTAKISSGTLRSAVEYGLPLPFYSYCIQVIKVNVRV